MYKSTYFSHNNSNRLKCLFHILHGEKALFKLSYFENERPY